MKRTIQIVLSLGLSALFIWLSIRGTNVSEIAAAIGRADGRWVLAYAGVLTAIHLVRVVRWGLLVEPIVKAPFRDLNELGAVGFMLLMVLPLRLGEFGRPLLIAERFKVSRTASLASVVIERIVDGLAMGLVLVVLLWTLGSDIGGAHLAKIRVGSVFVSLAFLGGLVALVLLSVLKDRMIRVVEKALGKLSPKLAERVAYMLHNFIEALRVAPTKRKLAEFFGLTALYWLLAASGLAVVGHAFGFELTLQQAFTVLGLQVIGSMIPAGPGMIGTIQVFTILGLGLFVGGRGLEAEEAGFAHTVWAMQFLQQVLFGLYFVAIGKVQLAKLAKLLRSNPATEAA